MVTVGFTSRNLRDIRRAISGMRTLGRIILTLVTIAMFWPATRLIIAAFKRSEPPMEIIKEAAFYTVVLVVIGWLYRRL